MEGKEKFPNIISLPKSFGYFVPKFDEIQSFSGERKKVLTW